ncbi:MAG: IS4 family transposase [Lachnospiraceae bacterium]|nr:IS4 family transposase [Lachnospiraceae bacterium]
MRIVNSTPNVLKENLDSAIQEVVSDFKENYHINNHNPDFSRKRVLTMGTVINLLLSMQGGSLKKELYDAGVPVSASAFVQQRDKIPWTVMEEVFESFNSKCKDTKTYKGYRVLAIDGTTINMARNPKSDSFVINNSTPKGYNQLHVNPLYDVLNKTYQYCVIQPQPQQDEVGALLFMMKWYDFKEKTLIVADRGYESYNVFAHIQNTPNTDFLIRVKQDRTAMREIGKLPMTELDTDVSFTITTTQTKEDKENGYILLQTRKKEDRIYSSKTRAGRWDFPSPYPMKIRVVRFKLDTGEYETLATSLPRSITLAEIKELYHARWGIETAFRELKYGIGLVNLHGKKDDFVRQEIFSAMIMSNFCSRIVNEVVVRKNDANIHEYKVNMTMAIHICRQFFRTKDADAKKLLQDIARYTEPVRPGRRDERNIKAKTFVGFIYRVSA